MPYSAAPAGTATWPTMRASTQPGRLALWRYAPQRCASLGHPACAGQMFLDPRERLVELHADWHAWIGHPEVLLPEQLAQVTDESSACYADTLELPFGIFQRARGPERFGIELLRTAPLGLEARVLVDATKEHDMLAYHTYIGTGSPLRCAAHDALRAEKCWVMQAIAAEMATTEGLGEWALRHIGAARIERSDRGTICARWPLPGSIELDIFWAPMLGVRSHWTAQARLDGRDLGLSSLVDPGREDDGRMFGASKLHREVLRQAGVLSS